jgi:hypothetical protein
MLEMDAYEKVFDKEEGVGIECPRYNIEAKKYDITLEKYEDLILDFNVKTLIAKNDKEKWGNKFGFCVHTKQYELGMTEAMIEDIKGNESTTDEEILINRKGQTIKTVVYGKSKRSGDVIEYTDGVVTSYKDRGKCIN